MTLTTRPRLRDTGVVALAVASSFYGANIALGTATGLRLVDTSRVRWVHHALYVATLSATVAALVASLRGSRALPLAAAVAALADVARTSGRSPRHPVVALTALPAFAAAFLRTEH